ncbi:MAG TPA: nitrile hydratase subunit alpha [Streptosporangiaceae bacterium]
MSDGHHGSGSANAPIAARVRRFEERLSAAGLVDDAELDAILDRFLAGASPLNGARIVARAWTDAGFRDRLLADANAALPEVGLSMRSGLQEQRLKVVANTAARHNVIVCTLCSCYPIGLLGPSPSWYKSEAYRSRVVRDPRAVLAEFGLRLPPEVDITVWDSSAESRYMVLPVRPAGTNDLTEAELAGLVTREGLIGTAAR